ncbi:hypothetical protein BKA58DRAFT_139915 [Alternaria rosae]|uniref:uncharacterized protein n=1 Tax=Alternaria rosae TaxID=1187941 RepID=UPI001E8DFD8D|nr:uncharacterized protein BKA58DRAFT_139915 [Alternaria rosae]KAH6872158.1 hypothetical protein BKA58DRAFT_139915 [Alternaria rosae]
MGRDPVANMPRRVKKSHVFATKSRPKRSDTAAKQKRHLPFNTPSTLEVSLDRDEPKEFPDSGISRRASSELSSRDGLLPEISTMATTPSMSVQPSTVFTASNSGCIVSKSQMYGATHYSYSGCASDQSAVLEHESCPYEPDPATSEIQDVTKHAAGNLDKLGFSKFLIQRMSDNKRATSKLPRPSSTHRTTSAFRSLGPSIMFSSLFDSRADLVPTPTPSTRQFTTAQPENQKVEQVPAYGTTTHAAWFSSPANKVVRGVPMGISRSVAELQRIARPTTSVLDLEASAVTLLVNE